MDSFLSKGLPRVVRQQCLLKMMLGWATSYSTERRRAMRCSLWFPFAFLYGFLLMVFLVSKGVQKHCSTVVSNLIDIVVDSK